MKKPKRLNLVFNRAGSKSSLVNKILEMLPASLPWGVRAVTIVEPFVGSAIVSSNIENLFPGRNYYALNDVERDLVNVFQCAKLFPVELEAAIAGACVHSQALYNKYKNILASDCDDPVARAAAYIQVSHVTPHFMTRGGYEAPFAERWRGITCDLPGSERLRALLDVCRRAHISCANAFDFMHNVRTDLRDGRPTFCFVDCPYVGTNPPTADAEYSAWRREDLRRLQALLDTLTIPWMLTHFPDPELEAWAAERGHTVTEIAKNKNVSAMAGQGAGHRKKTEIFVTNYSEFWAPEGGWEK